MSEKTNLKCPNCAAEIAPNTKFCGKCGSNVTITKSANPIHIGGVRFNLPNGFVQISKEDNKYSESSGANSYKHIYKRNNEVVTVTVATYRQMIVDDEFIRRNAEKNRWIKSDVNGVEAYLDAKTENITSYKIYYTQLNRYIIIIANSEVAKEFVVKNDQRDLQNLPQEQYKHSPNKNKLISGFIGLGVTLFIMFRAYVRSSSSGFYSILLFACILFLISDLYYIYKAYKGGN